MKQIIPANASPLCPSTTHPEKDESIAFGVVCGTVDAPQLAYLREPLPVTDELLSVSGSVAPTEVFRFAAPCANSRCSILLIISAISPNALSVCYQRL
jgi:hypothetical protein